MRGLLSSDPSDELHSRIYLTTSYLVNYQRAGSSPDSLANWLHLHHWIGIIGSRYECQSNPMIFAKSATLGA